MLFYSIIAAVFLEDALAFKRQLLVEQDDQAEMNQERSTVATSEEEEYVNVRLLTGWLVDPDLDKVGEGYGGCPAWSANIKCVEEHFSMCKPENKVCRPGCLPESQYMYCDRNGACKCREAVEEEEEEYDHTV